MIRLVPATDADSWFFLTQRNDPDFAIFSRRPWPITAEEHARWWKTTSDHRWVAVDDGEYVGTMRLTTEGEVSIVVVKSYRGKGYGAEMLEQVVNAAKTLGYSRIWGSIHPENLASQRAFTKAGWRPTRFEVLP